LSVRSVAVFQKQIKKKEKTKRTEKSGWGPWGWRSDRFLSRNRRPA
jgi:hypothetical protein